MKPHDSASRTEIGDPFPLFRREKAGEQNGIGSKAVKVRILNNLVIPDQERFGNFHEIIKKARQPALLFPSGLFRRNCSDGASVLARAAIDADVGIDDVRRISGSDRAYGTGIRARAAGYASIRNGMSHNAPPI